MPNKNKLSTSIHLLVFIALLAPIAIVMMSRFSADSLSETVTDITISDTVLASNAKRFGINVDARNPGEAAQHFKNILLNPGFEAGVFSSIIHVGAGSTGDTIIHNYANTRQPEGFWTGATFEFVDGPAVGRTGVISDFTHADSKYVFHLDSDGTVPNTLDALFVSQHVPGIANEWGSNYSADTSTTRPDSPGQQSVHLVHSASYALYMDNMWAGNFPTSGKMMLIEGNWRMAFWAKGKTDGEQVRVKFQRGSEKTFFDEAITLTDQWQAYTIDVNVPVGDDPVGPYGESGSHPNLSLNFYTLAVGSEIWLDDAALYSTDNTNPTAFTDAYVNVLKDLQPGILRASGNQAGTDLDTLLADPWARKTHNYSLTSSNPYRFTYSIHEFLELCAEVGAEPWLVLPPTLSSTDLDNLMAYLGASADGDEAYAAKRVALGQTAPWTDLFATIHIEYAHEAWTGGGKGHGFNSSTHMAQVANRRLAILKGSDEYDAAKFNLIIGGLVTSSSTQNKIDSNSDAHDTIGLAPNFDMPTDVSTPANIYQPLFARPAQDVTMGDLKLSKNKLTTSGKGTGLAIYGLNFNQYGGSASADIRNELATGMGNGIAQPLYMLTYLRHMGITDQIAHTSLGHAEVLYNGERVRLWGLLRDIAATGRKRPAWLGLELANKAIQGNLITTVQSGNNPTWTQSAINGIDAEIQVNEIQSFAFQEGNNYGLVVFNLSLDSAQDVTLHLPNAPQPNATHYQLSSPNISDNNEDAQTVAIQSVDLTDFSDNYSLQLPYHSVHVITWQHDPNAPTPTATNTPQPTPTNTPPPTPTMAPDASITDIAVGTQPLVLDIKRFGIQVPGHSRGLAAQHLKNIYDNPGFEASMFNSIIYADEGSSGTRIVSAYGDGQPAGYWTGATYEVASGPAKDRVGTVTDFTIEDGKYVFTLEGDGTALEEGDIVFMHQTLPGIGAEVLGNGYSADTDTTRPNSPGQQSLHMSHPAEYTMYWDNWWGGHFPTSGKMILIEGNWHLEFWAKGKQDGDKLRVRFNRGSEATFIDATFTLTDEWQQYSRDVSVPPGMDPAGPYTAEGAHPSLTVNFYSVENSSGADVEVWLDDVALYNSDDTNPTVFTDAYVEALQELNPGILRTGDQHIGTTLDAQLTELWARPAHNFKLNHTSANNFSYSLHEFLELSQHIGAEPWYLLPPTFSKDDYTHLMDYLSAPADGNTPYADKRSALGQSAPWTEVFDTIHLELSWHGGVNTGQGFENSVDMSRLAHDRFPIFTNHAHYDASRFNFILHGLYNYPTTHQKIDADSKYHDAIAVGPRIGILDDYATDAERYYPLFAKPQQDVDDLRGWLQLSQYWLNASEQGTGMAINGIAINTGAEEGISPDGNEPPLDVYNDFVTGLNMGIALPLHMLTYLRDLGITEQVGYTSLGFIDQTVKSAEGDVQYVYLPGMLRDIAATGRKRPTWLGMELVNKALQGDLVSTRQYGDNPTWTQSATNGITETINGPLTVPFVQSFAFQNNDEHSIVLFNLHLDESQWVRLHLPMPAQNAMRHQLASASIHDDNEDAEMVKIHSWSMDDFASEGLIQLPPHSVNVITWQQDNSAPTHTPVPTVTPTATPTLPPMPTPDANSDLTQVYIGSDPLVTDVKQMGVVVGSRTRWGAGQTLKNLIDNPGFESGNYCTVIHPAIGSTGQRIIQDFWRPHSYNSEYLVDYDWIPIGQPEGFWDGGTYEIVSGPAKGRRGTITNFTHEDDRNIFYIDEDGTAPSEDWDVVFICKDLEGLDDAAHGQHYRADTSTTRPGSPGKQSLYIETMENPEAYLDYGVYAYWMDSYWRDGDTSAGKLLPIEGDWRVEFWAKGQHENDRLQVRFFREHEFDFINRTLYLDTEWKQYSVDVTIPPGLDSRRLYSDSEYHPLLGLLFSVMNGGQSVWLDDVSLHRADDSNPTAFSDTFVDKLKELQPGILRDWGNQFGSTLDIQLAVPWARGTQYYKPTRRSPYNYSYSLHEFLELCQEVGAEPWYVFPPTFTPEELLGLIEYLNAPADGNHPYADQRAAQGQIAPWSEVFPTIHLEYGNELWGKASGSDPFYGASHMGGARLGLVAHDRLQLLKSSDYYDPDTINLIIGGQSSADLVQTELELHSNHHDTIGFAPYFGVLDDYNSDEEIYYPLFARVFQDITTGKMKEHAVILDGAEKDTQMAIYELNFHTNSGDAPIDIRNDFVAGLGGGIALPLYMLTYLREFEMRDQTAFTAVGYSAKVESSSDEDEFVDENEGSTIEEGETVPTEFVRIWGMLRDLEATGRKRPTWLGLELINKVLHGDMVSTVHRGTNPTWRQSAINGINAELDVPFVNSFAFQDGDTYSVVLFNLHLHEGQQVELNLPALPQSTATRHQLTADSINADNEESEQVRIETWPLTDFANQYTVQLPPHSVNVITWQQDTSAPALTPTPIPSATPTAITPALPVPTTDASANLTTIQVSSEMARDNVARMGLNLGARKRWGADQILTNLIDNPGLEAGVFNSVVHAAEGSGGTRFIQDFWNTDWNNDELYIGQPEDFWNGAEFEFVYGPAAGCRGTITDFTHESSKYVFHLDRDCGTINQWDFMFVRKQNVSNGLQNGFHGRHYRADTTTTRPGSPGQQSLYVQHGSTDVGADGTVTDEYGSFDIWMDSYWRDGDRSAGKLMPIKGNWHVEFWAKGKEEGDQLRFRFFREHEFHFIYRTIELTTEWQKYEFDLYVPPHLDPLDGYSNNDYHTLLGLLFTSARAEDQFWIDDIALYNSDYTNPTVFTDLFVDRIRELNPGVLRNWGGQLGSTLDAQLASEWARTPHNMDPQSRTPYQYNFSLHEFLELCQEIEAEPWYVFPPTLTEAELQNMVAYLSAPAGSHPYADIRANLGQTTPWTDIFPTIHLEYGNELWGSASNSDPFQGASHLGGIRLATVANDRLALLKASPYYDPSKLNLMIGGQEGSTSRQRQIETYSEQHDTIGLAPYIARLLDTYTTDNEIFLSLYARAWQDVTSGKLKENYDTLSENGTNLSIYELGFHTTEGDTPIDIRNDFVTGLGSGLALPFYMLTYLQELGIREQIAFSAAGFSAHLDESDEYVRLWGMLRDLEATGRKRPAWLGIELINRAIQGKLLTTTQSGDNPTWVQAPMNTVTEQIEVPFVHSFAFQGEGDASDEHSIVLFNLSLDQNQRVQLQLPSVPSAVATYHQLTSDSIHDDNEDAENVQIKTWTINDFAQTYDLQLPPNSLTVLTWTKAAPTPTPSATATSTPTATPSATSTSTPANSVASTATQNPTATSTSTSTATPTETATSTSLPTETATATPSSTMTVTPIATVAQTETPTVALTSTPTASPAPTITVTPLPTASPSAIPSVTRTIVPTVVSTVTPTTAATEPPTTASPTPTNRPPFAQNDAIETEEDSGILFAVLGNDTDPDGDLLQVTTIIQQPRHGQVSLHEENTLTYTPDADYYGTDHFLYRITDGQGNESAATVHITIHPVEDPPEAVPDAMLIEPGTSIQIDPLANDIDPDNPNPDNPNQQPGFELMAVGQPEHGVVTIDENGGIEYEPPAGFTGTDTFTYTVGVPETELLRQNSVSEPTAFASRMQTIEQVTIIVGADHERVTAQPDDVTTDEDTPLIFDVLTNDRSASDTEANPLTIIGVTRGRGSVQLLPDNQLRYIPLANDNSTSTGTDTFTYIVSDGDIGAATGSVTVNISPINDAPFAVDDTIKATAGLAVSVDVLANDTDIDHTDGLRVLSVGEANAGQVWIIDDKHVGYIAEQGHSGPDAFVYTVVDDAGETAMARVEVFVERAYWLYLPVIGR